ncbi:response regulator transcription factor [Pseudomonas sp. 18058]|uniref:response regulator transcription factor n=1 Tax=Pseudomonas sp. 18058 TaxID=2681406 RepID=UPI00135C06E9|nr:response regulator transcription factor [Pseudomonas sp. 18058]
MNDRVLIADDHPAVRMSVRLILEEKGYEVVGEAGDGVKALTLTQDLLPDVIILDIGLPRIDGLTVISRLKSFDARVKIIVLTGQESEQIALRCMQIGADAFVSKHQELCDLINALRAVKRGYSYSPDHACTLIRRHDDPDQEEELLQSLTARELMVLQQLARGISNKTIAERMSLSSKTVSTYKTRLLLKLNASTLLDLYDLAKRNGLTDR